MDLGQKVRHVDARRADLTIIVIGGGGVAPEPEIGNFIVLHFHSLKSAI